MQLPPRYVCPCWRHGGQQYAEDWRLQPTLVTFRQESGYFTLLMDFAQCMSTRLTDLLVYVTEECVYLWNGWVYELSKFGYKYINDIQGGKCDILPCSESFDKASALALRTYDSLWLRWTMIYGMTGLIACRNTTRNTSMMFRSENVVTYLVLRVSTIHSEPLF